MSITDLDEALATPGEATREYYREQGRVQERQRIANLIDFLIAYAVLLEDDSNGDIRTIEAHELITLIRGGKNE
jgi:hypothetical protein